MVNADRIVARSRGLRGSTNEGKFAVWESTPNAKLNSLKEKSCIERYIIITTIVYKWHKHCTQYSYSAGGKSFDQSLRSGLNRRF